MKNIFILKCCFIFSLTYFYFISNSHCGAEYGNQVEKIIVDNILLSEKDKVQKTLKELDIPFEY